VDAEESLSTTEPASVRSLQQYLQQRSTSGQDTSFVNKRLMEQLQVGAPQHHHCADAMYIWALTSGLQQAAYKIAFGKQQISGHALHHPFVGAPVLNRVMPRRWRKICVAASKLCYLGSEPTRGSCNGCLRTRSRNCGGWLQRRVQKSLLVRPTSFYRLMRRPSTEKEKGQLWLSRKSRPSPRGLCRRAALNGSWRSAALRIVLRM
jgi:hypothetical protein